MWGWRIHSPSPYFRLDFSATQSVHAADAATDREPPSSPFPGLVAGLWAVDCHIGPARHDGGSHAQDPNAKTETHRHAPRDLECSGSTRRRMRFFPFPQSLTAKGAILDKVIATLRKRNLIEERRVVDGAAEWRRDADSRAYGLGT